MIISSFAQCCCSVAAAKSLQSCPTLCNPIDGGPPGSPVPGILQARTLEWVAIFFSNAWKGKLKVKSLSRVQLVATPWSAAYQALLSMGFSRQEYWSGVPLPSPVQLLSWPNSLQPQGLQCTRLPCPSLSPGVCSNSCLLCQWCYPTISSSVSLFSSPQSFPASGSFPMSWLFTSGGQSIGASASASNEYSGLISFRMDWFDLFAVKGTLQSLPQHQSLKASVLRRSAFFMVQFSHPYMTIGKT